MVLNSPFGIFPAKNKPYYRKGIALIRTGYQQHPTANCPWHDVIDSGS